VTVPKDAQQVLVFLLRTPARIHDAAQSGPGSAWDICAGVARFESGRSIPFAAGKIPD